MSTEQRKTILLVEDEILIAMAQARTVEGFGYTVVTTASGEKAVELATGGTRPDLILMDIDLGKGLSGPEAAELILRKTDVPIVFLTSHAERDMVKTVRGITRYGYVVKNSGDSVLQSSIEMAFELFASSQRLKAELPERERTKQAPPLDSGAIAFEDLFNPAEIQRIQDEFSLATGVASIITHPDGTPLTAPSNFTYLCSEIIRKTEKGCSNCFRSDAAIGRYHPDGPVVQPCLSGGLWDAGASIVVGNRHIANWLIGQVRDETQSEENMRAYAREIGADEVSFMRAFHDVPAMSRVKFDQIAKVLFTLAGQLSRAAYQNVQQTRFITERQHAEEKIRTLLTEKEILLKEVHHRIKNNMNTMMSLLSLQAGSVKDSTSVAALNDARRRLQSMMVLYDRLYRSDGFRELSVRDYLTPLVHEIVGNFPNKGVVSIETHVDEFVLDSKTLAPLGIVVNELLTNAMKHAFVAGHGGSIQVFASQVQNRTTVAVQDNGIGLPVSFDLRTSAGFGLRLVDMLAEQLGGTVRVEREKGTRFILEFEV